MRHQSLDSEFRLRYQGNQRAISQERRLRSHAICSQMNSCVIRNPYDPRAKLLFCDQVIRDYKQSYTLSLFDDNSCHMTGRC